ncbi:MAG: TlpA disulfide reductase family protein [Acidobacteriaceae bacterium]
MKNVRNRVAAFGLAAVVLMAGGGLLFLKLVERRIATRMQAPHLVYAPRSADDLVYSTLEGEERHLSASRGRVVFLDLWGTWCIQCVVEMPTVQKLYDLYRNDPQVEFLIVSRLDTPATVRAYARRNHLDLPFYTMRDDDIPESMRLNQYPATFLYEKDGRLVAEHVAAANWADSSVIAFIDALKKQ